MSNTDLHSLELSKMMPKSCVHRRCGSEEHDRNLAVYEANDSSNDGDSKRLFGSFRGIDREYG